MADTAQDLTIGLHINKLHHCIHLQFLVRRIGAKYFLPAGCFKYLFSDNEHALHPPSDCRAPDVDFSVPPVREI